jgi:uncharacterized ParB-like nuclease family protein
MPSPIEQLLNNINPPAVRPLARYDVNKIRRGGQPLSNLQFNTAQRAILTGKPVFKQTNDHGILNDIVGLPGNLVRDATETAMGLFSPWKWVPSILHSLESGDPNSLLPLIPGYTTANNLVEGNFHDILTHPAGTALDILPYAHIALPHIGESLYGRGAAAAAEDVANEVPKFTTIKEPATFKGKPLVDANLNPIFNERRVPVMPIEQANEAGKVAPHLLERTLIEDRPAIDALKEDIAKNGMHTPIDILHRNGKNILWDGNHRLIAANELGLKEVPYRYVNETGEAVPHPVTPKPTEPTSPFRADLTPRQVRIAEAMREGKPGRTIFQALPERLSNPEEGIFGRRLTDMRQRAEINRAMAQFNRGFQHQTLKEYTLPLQDIFKDFDIGERRQFAQWWENFDENNPTQWTDVKGVVHEVPQKLQDAFPKVKEIADNLENSANDYLQNVWYKGRQLSYHKGSPVISAQEDIAKAQARLEAAQTAARDAREAWLKHQMEEVQPKTPVTVSRVVEPGSKATFEAGPVAERPTNPLYTEQDSLDARRILNGTYTSGRARPIYMAEDSELALGQGNEHPVKITLDKDKIPETRPNASKPFGQGEVLATHDVPPEAISEVRVPNVEQTVSPSAPDWLRDPHAGLRADLERRGFVGTVEGDETVYRRVTKEVNPVEPRPPVYSTLPRKSARLFRVQDRIDAETARLERLYNERNLASTREKFTQIGQRINNSEATLRKLQAERELLSRREMLVHNLTQSGNANFHVSPEDYDLLGIRGQGELAPAKAYRKALQELDTARKEAIKSRVKFESTLRANAPATYYPRIQDEVLRRIVEKARAANPHFLEGSQNFDWETTAAALDNELKGRGPVEAGLVTKKELNQITREVESTWQQMSADGFHPQYLSNVPESRFSSVLDPNLFRGGAVKDEPYAVRARTRDITPSGVQDPVIGLTAPAMSLLRRESLREFYNTHLSPLLKSESDLDAWLDSEIAKGQFKPLKPGESFMDRRNSIKASRWSAFDRENIDPELAQFFPKGERIYLPKEVNDTVHQMFTPKSDRLESISKANIHGMRVFRTAVMGMSAKHLAHILFGGLSMLLMRGGMEELSPSRMQAAWRMAKEEVMPKELSAGVDFYSGNQLAAGNLPAAEATNVAQKVGGTVARAFTKVQKFEERIANFERSLSYLSELERIMSGKRTPHLSTIENAEIRSAIEAGDTAKAIDLAKKGAISHANKALIDFDGMLPAERGIVRNIFPFYAFTRHIFKYALTYPIDYPLRASFVYRLGEIVQKDMQDQGLPEQWMRYLTFGPDKEGNVTNVDLRFLNPFRSLPDDATGSGLVNTLNPFLGYAMEWAGVNPWTTSPERFPDIRYNPQTGYVETKRKPFSLLGLVATVIPQAGALGLITGGKYGETSPVGISNQLSRYGFIPGLPHHDNINLQRATDTLGQFEVAQSVVSNALRTGDTSALRDWNLVPVPGQSKLVPGALLAKVIEGLPKNGLSPKRQLGVR